ncbi:hypothetical protein [Streptomyces sp. NPDC088746]|uniref:hypothetical protein n=1 Tax=Streptomyces sp. NPDC088746 TaxID=3365885 RepID=UPI00380958B3
MTELIAPHRAAEIKRAAARHAAGMLKVSLNEWAPQEYASGDARNDAEEELLRDEIERIAADLRGRSLVGTRQPCIACNVTHKVKENGTVGHHHGMDAAGFSTGRTCPGYGRPPATA